MYQIILQPPTSYVMTPTNFSMAPLSVISGYTSYGIVYPSGLELWVQDYGFKS